MSLERLTREEFGRELGLLDEEGRRSPRGLAGLARAALDRWGLSPRAELRRYVVAQLEAAGLAEGASERFNEVIEELVALGEVAALRAQGEPYLAPAEPCWVELGGGRGAALTVGALPEEVVVEEASPGDVVRRVLVRGVDDVVALRRGGLTRRSLDEWLWPLGAARVAARVEGRDEIAAVTLEGAWGALSAALGERGNLLGEGARVRALVGPPGGYFGRHDAPVCEGRWSEAPPAGDWCAYRAGHGDAHWHPILLRVDASGSRALDLFNDDEWCWALLARAAALGEPEHVRRVSADEVKLTFRPPRQLRAALALFGPAAGAWTWRASAEALRPLCERLSLGLAREP